MGLQEHIKTLDQNRETDMAYKLFRCEKTLRHEREKVITNLWVGSPGPSSVLPCELTLSHFGQFTHAWHCKCPGRCVRAYDIISPTLCLC